MNANGSCRRVCDTLMLLCLTAGMGLCATSDGTPRNTELHMQDISIPKSTTVRYVTPLLQAVAYGDESKVRALLQEGARPDDERAVRSPLIQAILTTQGTILACKVAIVKDLLDHGADPNRTDPSIGTQPLQTAFEVGDGACAQMIFRAGGKANLRDSRGETILEAATTAAGRTGNIGLLDIAIGMGVGPNSRNRDGSTALHKAVWIKSAMVTLALLHLGSDPCLRNGIGQTPLELAVNLRRSEELVGLLRGVTRCVTAQ